MILKRLTLNSVRTDVKPLPEADALQLGAEIIGEIFVYSIAAAIMTREYLDSAAKAQAKEEKLNRHLISLEQRIISLEEQLTAARKDACVAYTASASEGPHMGRGVGVAGSVESVDACDSVVNNPSSENIGTPSLSQAHVVQSQSTPPPSSETKTQAGEGRSDTGGSAAA